MYLNQKWNHYCYIWINICFLLLSNISYVLSSSHERSFAIHCVDDQCSNKQIILENSSCQYRGKNDILNYFWITCNGRSKRSTNERNIDDILTDLKDVQYYELHPLKRVKRDLGTTFIDPLFKEQWYFNEEGNGGYDLNVKAAWAKGYTGKGVVVSILDDGIQKNHPDLFANYDPNASYDINDDDDDPMPRDNGDNKHGTRCAGEVAAMANNDYCGVGVAYEANIGGVRMLDGTVNDNVESKALGLKPNYIDIYSASWGPEDDGKTVDGPGPLARRQFIHGVTHGRNGKGSIFIWASGNGGRHNDSCNCDGYTNSIFTLSISSATQGGYKPWYLEECSSTLTTTYSSGTPGHDKSVTTVDMDGLLRKDHICTVEHTGTSASAPLAAGCAALALQANPDLTWRDMQYMVVLTSRAEPLMGESGWFKNGANRYVSHKFGYGLIDAGEMVNLAEVWIPVPPQHICKSPEVVSDRKIESAPFSSLELSMHVHGCNNSLNEVQYLEHVQCKITLRFFPRGNLRILLTSPAGTTSTLLFERTRDVISSNFDDWPFMSVHFWGERPHGRWKLSIQNTGIRQVNQNGILKKWQLIFYGTAINPIRIKKSKLSFNNKQSFEYPQYTFGDFDPNFQFDSIYSGSNIEESIIKDQSKMTDVNCLNKNGCAKKCSKHEKFKENCVKECPNGTFEKSNHICVPCHDSCLKCTGPYQKDCLACSSSYFYLVDLKICMQHCPDGYYEDENKRICTPCTSNCGSCSDGPENCTRCHFHLVNYNNKCLASCPDSTYETNDNKCGLCHETCKTCSGPQKNQCFTCFPGTYELNNQCVKICPERMYADNDTSECRPCAIGCRTCSNAINCLTCDKNWVHFNSTKCVSKSFKNCNSDEYLEENGKCKKCHSSCKSCTSEDRKSCISCNSPLLLQRSQCVNQCLDGYFLNDVANICDICPYTCTKCTSLHTCSACKQSLVLQNNSCITSCHNGYYSDRGVCSKCDESCETCSGPQFDQCISCLNNMYLVNGKCLKKCPKGFYENSESMKCFKCDNLCPDCDKSDLCFNDVDNNVNEDNYNNENDDILIKKETINLEQQMQFKYVPLNIFSFENIYIFLILIVVIVILLISLKIYMGREYKSNSKRNLNSEIVYKVIQNSDENYFEDNFTNQTQLDKKSTEMSLKF